MVATLVLTWKMAYVWPEIAKYFLTPPTSLALFVKQLMMIILFLLQEQD